ncbi:MULTISPECIES: hypothetical protein [Paenibacillus]|uniref:hypothetical protein n=1 Tax=Paenibacillus TaxID=44249 RepID=UPI0022B936E9|nr:hypothetical protein [Paenibacillus caseinilyticus]MCZ8522075.1 hypothetical protein [Paenibacillus caseinilyticus]
MTQATWRKQKVRLQAEIKQWQGSKEDRGFLPSAKPGEGAGTRDSYGVHTGSVTKPNGTFDMRF